MFGSALGGIRINVGIYSQADGAHRIENGLVRGSLGRFLCQNRRADETNSTKDGHRGGCNGLYWKIDGP